MPLSVSALADAIASIEVPAATSKAEGDQWVSTGAIDAWVGAWSGFFAGASVAGVAVASGSLAAAEDAMRGAMGGLNTSATAALAAGLAAWWSALAGSGASVWPIPSSPVSAVAPPPGLSGTAGAIASAFAANAASQADKATAAQNLATALFPCVCVGAIATLIPPPPAPPVLTPVL